MEGPRLVLLVCSAASLAMTGIVGLRLLWLAWRSRGQAELLIGTAFTALTFVGVPLMGAAGMGRAAAGEIHFVLLTLGLVAVWLGLSCVAVFTSRTFHCEAGWANALACGISGALAFIAWGLVHSLRSAPPEMLSFHAAHLWSGLLRVPMIAIFVWSGSAAMHAHLMAERRMTLGLSEPVAVDRLWLWSLVGFSQAAVYATSLVLHARGVGMLVDPMGMCVVAVGGLLAAAAMYLTFLPPKAYLRHVHQHAELQSF
ncbi:MAG: hypothetical protein JRH19_20845 [Deltaproteobacteria bacterium]|nr:hypothetical protein [Deltaproteobacteria bacterium]